MSPSPSNTSTSTPTPPSSSSSFSTTPPSSLIAWREKQSKMFLQHHGDCVSDELKDRIKNREIAPAIQLFGQNTYSFKESKFSFAEIAEKERIRILSEGRKGNSARKRSISRLETIVLRCHRMAGFIYRFLQDDTHLGDTSKMSESERNYFTSDGKNKVPFFISGMEVVFNDTEVLKEMFSNQETHRCMIPLDEGQTELTCDTLAKSLFRCFFRRKVESVLVWVAQPLGNFDHVDKRDWGNVFFMGNQLARHLLTN